jgi:diaminobutyrate-2-oxoglutarate transaminase
VQTGCGRTGTWFAFEHYGIKPDVIIASKALSGVGAPVALIIYDERLDTWDPGAHSGTFRGNQLAFAAGVRAVEIVRREGILANVTARGEQLAEQFAVLREYPWVSDVRGLGLMWGIELADPSTGAPASAVALAVQQHALRHGLIIELGGRGDSVLRLLPPLNVTAQVVRTAADLLIAAIDAVTGEQS